MKWIFQFFAIVTPAAIFISTAMLDNKVSMNFIGILLSYLCIVGHAAVALLFFVLYIMLLVLENRSKRQCYTIAQIVCLIGALLFVCYVWITYQWTHKALYTELYVLRLDIIYKIADITLVVFAVCVAQYIAATVWGRSVIPFLSVKPKQPIGIYLRKIGVSDELIEKAYNMQQDDIIKNSKSEFNDD